jgi:nucleoside-triphosphatase THEP1
MKILIYSEAVHSGKTSRLKKWAEAHRFSEGFLCPDLDGRRMLMKLPEGAFYPYQMQGHDMGDRQDVVAVGKYFFRADAFALSRQWILAMKNRCKQSRVGEYWVIDEAGKLELKNQGLEPALGELLEEAKNNGAGNLILVVRDFLTQDMIAKYGLGEAEVIQHAFFE